MILKLVILLFLAVGSFFVVHKTEASPSTEVISQAEGEQNEREFLKYLSPVLEISGNAARIYYNAICQSANNYKIRFPHINVKPPSENKRGLAAIQDMFRTEKSVRVTEERPGIIDIRIGNAVDSIMYTRISTIAFEPVEQYNDFLAVMAIEKSTEAQAAMHELAVSTPVLATNVLLALPAEGLPHIPPLMTNVTMDEALDSLAREFSEVVLYGICTQEHLFRVHVAKLQ